MVELVCRVADYHVYKGVNQSTLINLRQAVPCIGVLQVNQVPLTDRIALRF